MSERGARSANIGYFNDCFGNVGDPTLFLELAKGILAREGQMQNLVVGAVCEKAPTTLAENLGPPQ